MGEKPRPDLLHNSRAIHFISNHFDTLCLVRINSDKVIENIRRVCECVFFGKLFSRENRKPLLDIERIVEIEQHNL